MSAGRRVRTVCISDTLPAGNVLVHAGGFTKLVYACLGEQSFKTEVVVNGSTTQGGSTSGVAPEQRDAPEGERGASVRSRGPRHGLAPQAGILAVRLFSPARRRHRVLVDGQMGCRSLRWALYNVRPRLWFVGSVYIPAAHSVCGSLGFSRTLGTAIVLVGRPSPWISDAVEELSCCQK